MTIAAGSGVRGRINPSRRMFSVIEVVTTWAMDLLGFDRVPAELVTQGGDHLVAEGIVLAREDPHEQAHRERRRRNRVIDRFLEGPASLARVVDVAADPGKLRVLFEGGLRQLEQP